MKVKEVLKVKGGALFTVSPDSQLSDAVVTMAEKDIGSLLVMEAGKLAEKPLTGVPSADTNGQAGFFDIVPHPDYAKNGWLYLAFSDMQERELGARLESNSISGLRRGDLVFWDNRCTMHRATEFDNRYRRLMRRTTVEGDEPFLE